LRLDELKNKKKKKSAFFFFTLLTKKTRFCHIIFQISLFYFINLNILQEQIPRWATACSSFSSQKVKK
jgi:pheromone shutdown protein TraB